MCGRSSAGHLECVLHAFFGHQNSLVLPLSGTDGVFIEQIFSQSAAGAEQSQQSLAKSVGRPVVAHAGQKSIKSVSVTRGWWRTTWKVVLHYLLAVNGESLQLLHQRQLCRYACRN